MDNPRRIPLPASRDPFINAHLTPAGHDPDTGEERFWLSSWNSVSGSTSALVTTSGKSRLYRFDPAKQYFGFYGAAYDGEGHMWLCGFADTLLCLDLATGTLDSFETGLDHSLVFPCFAYDESTKRIFCAIYSITAMEVATYTFDTAARTIISRRAHMKVPMSVSPRHIRKCSNGTYLGVCTTGAWGFLRWTPASDTVDILPHAAAMDNIDEVATGRVLLIDDLPYVPGRGVFNPETGAYTAVPAPSTEAAWFARIGGAAYGARMTAAGNAALYVWDCASGTTKYLTEIPDASSASFAAAADGTIVCMNLYGVFYRINPRSGGIETSVRLDTDAIGHMDCLLRIDDDRLLLTPFITQRFCELNIKTGHGEDLGRATAGVGEVLHVARLGAKIYMASYTRGHLVEYDPSLRAAFPENPHTVYTPPHGAMRPVGMCTDANSLYYACSYEYGHTGSFLTRYTPAHGEGYTVENPAGDVILRTLHFDNRLDIILGGTDIHSDCRYCPPVLDAAFLARFDPQTLVMTGRADPPRACELATITGRLSDGRYLVHCSGGAGMPYSLYLDPSDMSLEEVPLSLTACLYTACGMDIAENSQKRVSLHATPTPGLFVAAHANGISLWHHDRPEECHLIGPDTGFYHLEVDAHSIYLLTGREVIIYENIFD